MIFQEIIGFSTLVLEKGQAYPPSLSTKSSTLAAPTSVLSLRYLYTSLHPFLGWIPQRPTLQHYNSFTILLTPLFETYMVKTPVGNLTA